VAATNRRKQDATAKTKVRSARTEPEVFWFKGRPQASTIKLGGYRQDKPSMALGCLFGSPNTKRVISFIPFVPPNPNF
jgi:hypothetical protein